MSIEELKKALDNRPKYRHISDCEVCARSTEWFKDFTLKFVAFQQTYERQIHLGKESTIVYRKENRNLTSKENVDVETSRKQFATGKYKTFKTAEKMIADLHKKRKEATNKK